MLPDERMVEAAAYQLTAIFDGPGVEPDVQERHAARHALIQAFAALDREALIATVESHLRHNDECGPGPVSEREYRDDATEILRAVGLIA